MRDVYRWLHGLGRAVTAAAIAIVATSAAARAAALTPVVHANPKTLGISVPNVLSVELSEQVVAQGSNPVENPLSVDLGDGTLMSVPFYGYDGDGPFVPLAGDVQTPDHNVEAKKTEPDKNTYLVVEGQHGADPTYDYGTHFVYQGHEGGPTDPDDREDAAITRVNLDADGPHRVTILAIKDVNGDPLPAIDGSTWDPFAQHLLFTAEQGGNGGVWQATLDFPSAVEPLPGSFGHASFEGIQNDSDGNVWLVEDSSGAKGSTNTHARQPNSFLFRFIPD